MTSFTASHVNIIKEFSGHFPAVINGYEPLLQNACVIAETHNGEIRIIWNETFSTCRSPKKENSLEPVDIEWSLISKVAKPPYKYLRQIGVAISDLYHELGLLLQYRELGHRTKSKGSTVAERNKKSSAAVLERETDAWRRGAMLWTAIDDYPKSFSDCYSQRQLECLKTYTQKQVFA